MKTYYRLLVSILFAIAFCVLQAQPIIVHADKITAPVQPTMWGIFFEDINMGADGGLYAELIKNRSFEFYVPLMGWKLSGSKLKEGDAVVVNRKEANTANPRFLKMNVHDASTVNDCSLTNEGFRGIGIKQGLKYNFSVLYRQRQTGVKMHIELIDTTGKVLGSTMVMPTETGDEWHKGTATLIASETLQKAKFRMWFEGNGVIDLDMISLFPSDTWKNKPGGMRADMVQMLADMKPGFIRFPGGCIVEGRDLNNRYQWKKTVGPVEDRQLIMNRWNTEFSYRLTPDYFQTFGLGFFEYFQLAEDIGASPLPILNCGMACQFNSAELASMSEIDPYVQDALDLVEFANGNTATRWGKLRSQMGHPASFNLKMMGVGNENWGPQYLERLQVFTKALNAKYPDIKIVNSSGTNPDGDRFDLLNTALRKNNADFIDEHYYQSPDWFFQHANRYDDYDRNGSKVFAGEYASHTKSISAETKNNWLAALSEAAFMTGLERNAGVVYMASYAPLFAHIDGWQWSPDLIWVDNLRSYGTPDYYVQKLYSVNKGTHVVSILKNNQLIEGKDSLYATACIDKVTNDVIIKLVNASATEKQQQINIEGTKGLAQTANLTALQSNDLTAFNSFDQPENISPKEQTIKLQKGRMTITMLPYSFEVIRVKMR